MRIKTSVPSVLAIDTPVQTRAMFVARTTGCLARKPLTSLNAKESSFMDDPGTASPPTPPNTIAVGMTPSKSVGRSSSSRSPTMGKAWGRAKQELPLGSSLNPNGTRRGTKRSNAVHAVARLVEKDKHNSREVENISGALPYTALKHELMDSDFMIGSTVDKLRHAASDPDERARQHLLEAGGSKHYKLAMKKEEELLEAGMIDSMLGTYCIAFAGASYLIVIF